MQTFFPNIGLKVPEIYLPKEWTDLKKRAVVACDQYTSQPKYREEVKNIAGQEPSTYNIIFPEIYLEEEWKEKRIQNIQSHMNTYINEWILENKWPCFVLIDRKTSHQASRKWLIVALDLEAYDYSKDSQTLIRATEGTIVDRLPPRIEIRKDAPLESPHIMVLIDDPQKTVIEPLFNNIANHEKLYDTDLMMNGGHITWYKIADETSINTIASNLEKLADKEVFKNKYALNQDLGVLLFAMGDGNHSLATAKAIREEKKQWLSEEEKLDHPARFALVELVNIHDDWLVFEPIHRVIFHVDAEILINEMKTYIEQQWSQLILENYPTFEEMKKNKKTSDATTQYFCMMYANTYIVGGIQNPKLNLEVGNLQAFLDEYLKKNNEIKIDYIHGEDITEELGTQEWNIGFTLPIMNKSEFFKTVIVDWALPRKTFSMGEAEEKRYYFECRKIK